MVSLWLFTTLVALLALQRIWEQRRSRQNEVWLQNQGGQEHHPGHYPVLVGLHSTWFAAMRAEAWLLHPEPSEALMGLAGLGLLLGQCLRYAAMRTLGSRWSTRIYVLPGQPRITTGPYRLLRHPNYLGVMLEIAVVPLLGGAWRTALVWSVANLFLLWHRIRLEDRVLAANEP